MGIVTTVEKSGRFVRVSVDGISFLKLQKAHFEAMPLAEGEAVDEDAYLDRLCALQAKDAYNQALTLLSARDMTRRDMKSALTRRGFLEAVADATVARLCEARLIDDAKFAARYVELKKDGQAGRYALAQKLRAKGIDEDIAARALEQLDDEDQLRSALALARRLAPRWRALPLREGRAKLSQALARRGFGWDAISAATEAALAEEDDSE